MVGFLIIIGLAGLGLSVYIVRHLIGLSGQLEKKLDDNADNLSEQLSYQLDLAKKDQALELNQQIAALKTELYQQLADIRDVLHQNLTDSRDRSDQRLELINQNLTTAVQDMQRSNEKRLDQMRQTVEEKLEQTLQSRLKTSFETVSKQLESVNQGLGEMKSVAQDVGTLNKVLSNTKTRGIMGELQLGQIIEDIMTDSQYEREFATVKGSSERVEYAIKLPGSHENDYVYLPIDSKFPLEDYYRLEEAYESGDSEQIDNYRKSLLASLKRFAKDIQKKYLNPPETTNFGIMFLPTEGLYSEVVRNSTFFDDLRREEHIVVAGPSTLSALLNSLSVGFKTLNIQKNADDISKILGNVKTEFTKFGGMLTKAQKQLNTASKTVDTLLTTRTNAIIKALDTVEDYQDASTQSLLSIPQIGGGDDHED
ncbi:DNA recombination protein RmuC [Streptococcus dentasini]